MRLLEFGIVVSLCLCCVVACGSNDATTVTTAALQFSPTEATITAEQCQTQLTLTNTSANSVVLHLMQISLTNPLSAANQVNNLGAEELATLFSALQLGVGSQVVTELNLDVSAFSGANEIEAQVILHSIATSGQTLIFFGTLTCLR